MAREDDSHGEAHDADTDPAGDDAGEHGKRCETREAVCGGEHEQQRQAAGDVEQNHEQDGAQEVERGEKARPVHAIGEDSQQNHADHVEATVYAIGRRPLDWAEPTEFGIGQEVDLDHAGGREPADDETQEQQPKRPAGG